MVLSISKKKIPRNFFSGKEEVINKVYYEVTLFYIVKLLEQRVLLLSDKVEDENSSFVNVSFDKLGWPREMLSAFLMCTTSKQEQ